MKKYLKLVLPAIIILILGSIFWQVKTNLFTTKGDVNPAIEAFASLKVSDGVNSASFDISGFVGKTALEATESKVKVAANGSGANTYITSINGRGADVKKREFWELDVNGAQAQVGAGSYIIQNHDEIQWKITNF
jgi:hypothetical protein